MKMNVNVEEIKTLKIAQNEALLVKCPNGTSMATIRQFQNYLVNLLETNKIVVYASDSIEFLKVQLEEQVIDNLIDTELKK